MDARLKMLSLYKNLMSHSEPLLRRLLDRRLQRGKEHAERLSERMGIASRPRPEGPLVWVHAASVGEAQSALIMISALLNSYANINVMVSTGTLTSARMLEKNLPPRAFHQFYPLDHPEWVRSFLDHWQPHLVLWMESELWPNMLQSMASRDIPALLINARLSPASYKRWLLLKPTISKMLSVFDAVLCQTETDTRYFETLGASTVVTTDNLKYSAKPLPFVEADLQKFHGALRNRPCWVMASSHRGEEVLAAHVHDMLLTRFPEMLTVIVPRHPERREEIRQTLSTTGLTFRLRGEEKRLPDQDTDLYVADTLGELGLFYRAAPVAFIGRTMSADGGGGHNPIEAARLGCAVLHGPKVQNLQHIFDEMDRTGAAVLCADHGAVISALSDLLGSSELLQTRQDQAINFAKSKERVLEKVMPHITSILERLPELKTTR